MKTIVLILMIMTTAASAQRIDSQAKPTPIRVAVWDTYVTRKDGKVMHFDIIAPEAIRDTAIIHGYGREYLKSKGQEGQQLTSKECRFCHVRAMHPMWEADIRKQGYYILELENCN